MWVPRRPPRWGMSRRSRTPPRPIPRGDVWRPTDRLPLNCVFRLPLFLRRPPAIRTGFCDIRRHIVSPGVAKTLYTTMKGSRSRRIGPGGRPTPRTARISGAGTAALHRNPCALSQRRSMSSLATQRILHTFGDRAQTQALRQPNRGARDRGVVLVARRCRRRTNGRSSARAPSRAGGTSGSSCRCRSRRSTATRRAGEPRHLLLDEVEVAEDRGLGDLEHEAARPAARAGAGPRRRHRRAARRRDSRADRLTATLNGRPGRCHCAHSATAWSSTRHVKRRTRLDVSTRPMKSRGLQQPARAGAATARALRRPRARRSRGRTAAGSARSNWSSSSAVRSSATRLSRSFVGHRALIARLAVPTHRAAPRLRLIHRDVGVLQQLVERGAVFGMAREADAAADREAHAVDLDGLRGDGEQSLADRCGRRAVAQKDRKLVAPEARHRVVGRAPEPRSRAASRAALRRRTAWPRPSLTSLKWSRSMSITAKLPARPPDSSSSDTRSCSSTRFGNPVSGSCSAAISFRAACAAISAYKRAFSMLVLMVCAYVRSSCRSRSVSRTRARNRTDSAPIWPSRPCNAASTRVSSHPAPRCVHAVHSGVGREAVFECEDATPTARPSRRPRCRYTPARARPGLAGTASAAPRRPRTTTAARVSATSATARSSSRLISWLVASS